MSKTPISEKIELIIESGEAARLAELARGPGRICSFSAKARRREHAHIAAYAALGDSELAAEVKNLEGQRDGWEAQFMSAPAWLTWDLGRARTVALDRESQNS